MLLVIHVRLVIKFIVPYLISSYLITGPSVTGGWSGFQKEDSSLSHTKPLFNNYAYTYTTKIILLSEKCA